MKKKILSSLIVSFLASLGFIPAVYSLEFNSVSELKVKATATKQARKGATVADRVERIARNITVRIDSENSGNGSGVIIAKKGKTYYVATAKHVVESEDRYQIVTPDGQKYTLKSEDISPAPGFDGAIVKFSSSKNYQVATIGNYDIPLMSGQWVFVYGFPATLEGTPKLTSGFRLNRDAGALLSKDNLTFQNNYQLIYTNLSQPGMSGGPVLDRKGQVIGINAGFEGEQISQEKQLNIGFSIGVPTTDLLGLTAKNGLALKQLKISNTLPKELSQTEINNLKNHPSFRAEKPANNATVYDWIDYGNQLWRLGELDEAIVAIQKAIKLDPNKEQAYFALGLVYSFQKKYQLAVEQFDRVIEDKFSHYQALTEKSWALIGLKKLDEALNAIDGAIEWQENDFKLNIMRAHILDNLGKFDLAIEAYTKSIEINPNSVIAYNDRGYVYYKQGRSDLALADFNKSIALNSNVALAYGNRGFLYYNQGKYDLALADYNKTIAIDPNLALAYNNRGLVYDALQKPDLALADYNQAIKTDYNDPKPYYNRGLLYYNQGKLNLALADWNQAISINPNFAQAYGNRGFLYYNQGKYDLALADYNKTIAIDPNLALVYNNRGLLYDALQKFDLALADFNQALSLDPSDPKPYYNRANLYYKLQNYDLALADYNRAITLNDRIPEFHYNRGYLYFNLQKYDLALSDFNKFIEINPNFANAYANRGIVYINLGNKQKAISDLKIAARLFEKQRDRDSYQTVINLLAQLQ